MSIAKLNAQIQMITTLQYWLAIGVVYAKCCSNKAESLEGHLLIGWMTHS